MTEERANAEFMVYMRRMVETYEEMTEDEKEELHRWEREHLDGRSIATSDWPGWAKYIGKPPWKEEGKIATTAQNTSVELNASRNKEVRIPCALCRTVTKHVVVSSVDITQDVHKGEIMGWTSYQIVRCLGCESFSFRRIHQNTEDFDLTDEGEQVLEENVEVYPPRAVGRQKLRDSRLLPHDIRAIYDETYKAVCSELPILAAVGMRALIETVCKEENAQGINMKEKIDDLVNKRVLAQSGADILHELRFLGNKAAHEVKRHDAKTLGTAFDVIEHLLQGVYIFPAEFD